MAVPVCHDAASPSAEGAMRKVKGTDGSGEAPAVTPRGADEDDLAFLGTRQEATPLSAPMIREKLQSLARSAEAFDRASALTWYDEGETLIVLYKRHADAVLGEKSFRAFLRKHWPLDLATAYERMRFAKFATRAQVEKYRYTRTRLAVRLVQALGLADLTRLEAVDLRLPADEGGGTVRLGAADAEQLAAALRVLKAPVPDDVGESDGERLVATRAWVKSRCEEDEEFAALAPTTFLAEGTVCVRVTARGAKQARAAARFYEKLGKRR
jgi:hypothetical protein